MKQPPKDGKQMVNKNLSGYSYRPKTADNSKTKPEAKPPKERSWKRIVLKSFLGLVILVLVLVIIWASWVGVAVSKNSQKIFGSGNLLTLLSNSPPKNQDGRVNILLAGYSVDDPGHPGANLTDSIMLISLDTKKHTGYMLSIPRDFYVDIPGYGHAKINEAYQDGGMSLLEQVVSNDLNVPINYYVLTNYAAFRDAVNAVGGITINIQSPDPRGLYDPNINVTDGGPLKLSNGVQTLDGQTALNLARARGDSPYSYGFPQSDFNRTQHQRQMISALGIKATQFSIVANPMKVGKLFAALGNNVKTDIKMNNLLDFYKDFHSIKSNNLQSLSLNDAGGTNLLRSYTTYSGQSALIPATGLDDYSQIQAYINQINQN